MLRNDARQEVGYHYKHSKEPLPLLSDSIISGLGGEWHDYRTFSMVKVNS